MPRVYLPSMQCAIASSVDVATWRVKKNLGRGAKCSVQSTTNVGRSGRIRSVKPDSIVASVVGTAALKTRLQLRPLTARANAVVNVTSFVATVPSAPPEGRVHQTTIAGLINNANSPTLNGARLVRGDLEPICFKIVGQKLEGLEADFIAKPRNSALGLPNIVKSNIHLTAPSIDPATNVETLMGQFAIEPQDTISLPDQEVEYVYQLKFSDGIGRVYTLEMGYFTVYPALV